ncbi:NADH-quinone oxidoreductase subunit A [Buchnera aphidicola (Nipponaphis monzeni)]|uniref:NADH-quinone oxidoreductase subunit A n=1 Tax=Buchnera aphidicola (Nipponaphis monzeni) TaxID=2495405 RepID=A0A455T9V4_9GAMM|nr:NADH-quinone oxidoreductase subunit A [Buchnera aphidicola]BBI01137.1 NADH-quinone oxidoreductase subunit A [Buchnera aphidicola (Nipponaphis monzeni)]
MNNLETSTQYMLEYYTLGVFFLFSMCLCVGMLVISYTLGGKSYGRFKNVPFESGIISVGDTNLKFSIHFYLMGMFFLIFDVESIYIYIWSISYYKLGWLVFSEMFMFIFSLLLGLFYLSRIGSLDWVDKKLT